MPKEDWIQQEIPNKFWIQKAASTSNGNWSSLPLRIDGLFCAAKRGCKNFDSILIDSSKGSLILNPAAQKLESAPGLPSADSRQVMVQAFQLQARSRLGTVPWPPVLVRVCCSGASDWDWSCQCSGASDWDWSGLPRKGAI